MHTKSKYFRFIGSGTSAELEPYISKIQPWGNTIGNWKRGEDDEISDESKFGHPAGYITDLELVEAVNTTLILRKPLLVTGNPGTGKSELAERIAWEFNIGPVLRFEAQSLSEANDLFYRFDLLGYMAATKIAELNNVEGENVKIPKEKFINFGPLGKAILRSNPEANLELFSIAFPRYKPEDVPEARPSVVLIDEIDKASRDFPNDLLNSIQRLEFRIRELQDRVIKVPNDEALWPIVIITSNSERDLPAPFLRRCTYYHIDDPDINKLRRIVQNRVFNKDPKLPPLYEDLLVFFDNHRKKQENQSIYQLSASELIDWTDALKNGGEANDQVGIKDNFYQVSASTSAVAKNNDDREALLVALKSHTPKPE